MEIQEAWSGHKCSLIELVYHLLVESASITEQESSCVTSSMCTAAPQTTRG